jgi:hypothetical protein
VPVGIMGVDFPLGFSVGVGWAGREPIYPWEAKVYAAV